MCLGQRGRVGLVVGGVGGVVMVFGRLDRVGRFVGVSGPGRPGVGTAWGGLGGGSVGGGVGVAAAHHTDTRQVWVPLGGLGGTVEKENGRE